MKTLFAITIIATFLNANSLQDVINSAINKNYELKSIEKSLLIANENINLATKLNNPTLVLGINGLYTNDIVSRDKEPMQAQYIGFSQTIPLTNKLNIKKSIELTNKQILNFNYEDKKLLLKSQIYNLFYKIDILEKKLSFLEKKFLKLEKIVSLQKLLYKTSNFDIDSIYTTNIKEQKLKIEINNIKTNLKILKLNFEKLAYFKYKNIKINTKLDEKTEKIFIENHPKIQAFTYKQKLFKQEESFYEASKTSDIKLNATYFNRDTKYQDYVNFSVAIPISIYNKENLNIQKSKYSFEKAKDDLLGIKQQFKIDVSILNNNIKSSYLNHKILNIKINKLQNEIEKSVNQNNNFSNNSIKILNEEIKSIDFKLQALNEKEKYFEAKSKLIYYKGI